jgi:hypothetical protein
MKLFLSGRLSTIRFKFDRSKTVWGVYYDALHMPNLYGHMGCLHEAGYSVHRLHTPFGRLEILREWADGLRFTPR